MAESAEIAHLHHLLYDEEDHEEDDTLDLSVQLVFSHDAQIRPSEGGKPESDSAIFRHNPLGGIGKTLTLDRSVAQNLTQEPWSRRHLHQVNLSGHLSTAQLDSMTYPSAGSPSSVDFGVCEGDDELDSDYLGLELECRLGVGLGFDGGDWGRFPEHDYQEDDLGDIDGDTECQENSLINGISVKEEESGVGLPVVLIQNSVPSGSIVESGDSGVMVGIQPGSLGASISISVVETADLVAIGGNSCKNGDFNPGIERFGVVGWETDSDEEEFLDPQEDGSPVLGRNSNFDANHRPESDALANDVDYPLCWDYLHLGDQTDSDEDYEWEEVDGGIDLREALTQSSFIYGESTSGDIVVHRVLPEVLELHESNSVEVSYMEVNSDMHVANGNDTLVTVENLDWAVLAEVNDLEASNFDEEEHDAEIHVGGSEGFVRTTEYQILVGQFANNDNFPRGIQPASKRFVDSLPSVSFLQNNCDDSRNVCAVCKDEISREELAKQLPCSHCYHGGCILPWLSIRSSCPVCRYQLPTDDSGCEQWRIRSRQ